MRHRCRAGAVVLAALLLPAAGAARARLTVRCRSMRDPICTRCGDGTIVAHGQRVCVADWLGEQARAAWTIAVCRSCGREDVAEDLRKTKRMNPLVGGLLTLLGLGVCGVALISLTEPGWEKLWAVPFAFLGVPAAAKGVAMLVTMPMALKQLKTTVGNLETECLTPKDRDLLVHLEAHRVLQVLQSGDGWLHGGLRLPPTPGAKPKSIRYSLQRTDPELERQTPESLHDS